MFGVCVSIHAPREGCDAHLREAPEYLLSVSIHAPREGCDARVLSNEIPAYEFQFTHPGRGATYGRGVGTQQGKVSIHAPREGCDLSILTSENTSLVSIHAPREGCDFSGDAFRRRYDEFQFTHPGRGAT